MSIKKYNSFINEDILALPPHKPNEDVSAVKSVGDAAIRYTITQLYNMEHKDIVLTSSRINAILEDGMYLKLRDKKYGIVHLNQNEPITIFPVREGNVFSVGSHKNIQCDDDSLIIWSKSYDSLFVISQKDFDNMEIAFIRPKRIVAPHDPYGEEDWDDEEIYESVETKEEEITIKKSMSDIFDHLITYDAVYDYLKKELIGKEVEFVAEKPNDRDIRTYKGIVENVILTAKHYNFYFVVDGIKYWVSTESPMTWKKTVTRNITEEDPYGEEDWE